MSVRLPLKNKKKKVNLKKVKFKRAGKVTLVLCEAAVLRPFSTWVGQGRANCQEWVGKE